MSHVATGLCRTWRQGGVARRAMTLGGEKGLLVPVARRPPPHQDVSLPAASVYGALPEPSVVWGGDGEIGYGSLRAGVPARGGPSI